MPITQQRMGESLRESLAYLAQHDSKTRKEVMEHLAAIMHPTTDETELDKNGRKWWELWTGVGTVKAGWMTKDGGGVWAATQSGHDALAQYADSEAFRLVAHAVHRSMGCFRASAPEGPESGTMSSCMRGLLCVLMLLASCTSGPSVVAEVGTGDIILRPLAIHDVEGLRRGVYHELMNDSPDTVFYEAFVPGMPHRALAVIHEGLRTGGSPIRSYCGGVELTTILARVPPQSTAILWTSCSREQGDVELTLDAWRASGDVSCDQLVRLEPTHVTSGPIHLPDLPPASEGLILQHLQETRSGSSWWCGDDRCEDRRRRPPSAREE